MKYWIGLRQNGTWTWVGNSPMGKRFLIAIILLLTYYDIFLHMFPYLRLLSSCLQLLVGLTWDRGLCVHGR